MKCFRFVRRVGRIYKDIVQRSPILKNYTVFVPPINFIILVATLSCNHITDPLFMKTYILPRVKKFKFLRDYLNSRLFSHLDENFTI